ncbi:MAG: LSU ribosomal protein L4p (L1e) [uncultured Chloroflexia bacterium]|uniref:Large ribosomal subunit protein uL4 n=1 Tax=uncultured Chloroflexia bacterium TaxID=1672391 RepID=A0A6J4HHL4_9CHLR|nr:MAG: LSU ribosomal protein L4p (L1e) [uncultured Chloroflexia bacterium]
MQATLYNQAGAEVGAVELSEYIFGIKPNVPVMHQMMVLQQANARQGTSNTRTRGQVRGSTRKIYRQKGTGRARQGSIRAPHHSGGGVVFGPHPRKYTQSMPKKMRRLAVRSALSAKHSDGQLRFVDAINMEAPRTKAMIEVLQNLQIGEAKTLILMSEKDENIVRSASNLGNVKTLLASYLNVVDLLKYDIVLVPHAALAQIEQWLGDGRTEAEPEAEVESV